MEPKQSMTKMVDITFGDMGEALYQLRQKEGLFASLPEHKILERAIQNKSKKMTKKFEISIIHFWTALVIMGIAGMFAGAILCKFG